MAANVTIVGVGLFHGIGFANCKSKTGFSFRLPRRCYLILVHPTVVGKRMRRTVVSNCYT
jgi:hypothetical protein